MNSETSVNYACYYLFPKLYVKPPDGIRCCPVCGGALSASDISPSRTVASYLAIATMPYHNFSHLYDCPACHWWAIWESFGDAEYSPDYSLLIASLPEKNQMPLDQPWSRVLENENVYDQDVPLPASLEQVFIGGKKRIFDLPKPGDKVRLVGNVHMLQDLELIPLFISGSEGSVMGDEELYSFFLEESKQEAESMKAEWQDLGVDDWDADEYIRVQFENLKWTMEAKNCCPIRLEKLVVSPGREHHDLCKKGDVYFIYAADISKIDDSG